MNFFSRMFSDVNGKPSSDRIYAGIALLIAGAISCYQVWSGVEVDHVLVFEFLSYAFGAKFLAGRTQVSN